MPCFEGGVAKRFGHAIWHPSGQLREARYDYICPLMNHDKDNIRYYIVARHVFVTIATKLISRHVSRYFHFQN